MMGSGRLLRAQLGRVVVELPLPKPLNLVVLVVAVAGLFLLTVASYTRNGPS